MANSKDGIVKFEIDNLEFESTGTIGAKGASDPYFVGAENQLRVVTENVGAGNEVEVLGKIRNQSNYTVLLTVTGPTDGITVDISLIDEIYFSSSIYSASGGTPRLVAAGFFKQAGNGTDSTTASNLGSGEGVFGQKVGDDLQFKSLTAGSGITLTPTSDTITIAANSTPRLSEIFDTDLATAIGDLVVVTGVTFVSTITDNLETTMPNGIFGIAFSKPTTTTVEVIFVGVIGGYAGFTTGDALFVSTSGVPSHVVPLSEMVQQIGFAISTTQFFMYPQQAMRRA